MKHKIGFLGRVCSVGKGDFDWGGIGGLWREFKVALIILLVALMILLGTVLAVAQRVTVKGPGIGVGESVPDVAVGKMRVSDFRGKVLILDFWATWCAPCVAMMPRMDSLQREFAGKLEIVGVAYQDKAAVTGFIAKLEAQEGLHYSMKEVYDDKALSALFPHGSFPHYVWIGPDGRVAAITGFGELDRKNVMALLGKNGGSLNVALKQDLKEVRYDYHKPLLLEGNGGLGRNLLYHSELTSYTPGLRGGLAIVFDSLGGKKITCKNWSIHRMMELAWSDSGRNFNELNTRYLVADTDKIMNRKQHGQVYLDWLSRGNGFCYELSVPPGLAPVALKMMREDLDRYFIAYKAQVVRQRMDCLVLSRVAGGPEIRSDGRKPEVDFDRFHWVFHNCSLEVLAERLSYDERLGLPVVDETRTEYPVDLDINVVANAGGRPDLVLINKELSRYGLKLGKAPREIEQLVISDRK